MTRGMLEIGVVLLAGTTGCQASRPATIAVPREESHEISGDERGRDQRASPLVQSTVSRVGTWRPTNAEEVVRDDSMTLADLEGLAFQHNPTLSGAAARVAGAQGRHVQAGLYPNPVAGYHATEVGNVGTPGQQGGFISQRFITGGKLHVDQAIAAREIDEAQLRLDAQEQRVLNDVRVRFYETLVAQQRVELTEELAGIGDNQVRAASTLLKNGQGTDHDLLQARIRADETHILLDNASNELDELRRRLAAVAGIQVLPSGSLAGKLDSTSGNLEWDDVVAATLADHPDLNAARTRVERANHAIERATLTPIPDVDVAVSVRYHNVTGSDVANVQVGIPIPVFDGNEGNISATQAELVAAKKNVERIELELWDRLAVEFRKYTSAQQQIERYAERIVPQAKTSLQLVTEGYESGQVDYFSVLKAQQTYVQVRLSYLDSLREAMTSRVLLDGQLLSNSLDM